MYNPILQVLGNPGGVNPQNPMMNNQNPFAMIAQLQQQFAGRNPQEVVQSMVQSGQVSQAQVDQAVQMAQSFMGSMKK